MIFEYLSKYSVFVQFARDTPMICKYAVKIYMRCNKYVTDNDVSKKNVNLYSYDFYQNRYLLY